jgi:mannose-6-phosphate isomerase-like protein (cupin superfamily)
MTIPSTAVFQTKQRADHADYIAPDGSEIRLLAEGLGGGLSHCMLPQGSVSKAVAHQTVEEIWYCICGHGQVWRKWGDAELTINVSPGSSLTIPKSTVFQFRNTGDAPLCFVIATIPRWPGPEEAIPQPGKWERA